MNTITNLIERLRHAPTNELSQIRAEYEAYLTTLSTDDRRQVASQVNPVLRELATQSVDRLEAAASLYVSRKGRVTV